MLIGLTGAAGAGKDTVADMLVEKFSDEKSWVKLSMAHCLKRGLTSMGFPEPEDRTKKEQIIEGFNFSWREAAQKLGTEWGRSLDPDIWIKLMIRQINSQRSIGHHVVVSDIRFDNEATMIKCLGGIVVRVQGRCSELGEVESKHSSEAGIYEDLVDLTLLNTGSRLELLAAVARMLINLGEGA